MKNFTSKTMQIIALALFFFMPIISLAQSEDSQKSIVDTISFGYKLFDSEEPLKISLKSDFRKFRKDKFEGKYQPAELSYAFDDTVITKIIRIKARGKNRKENCSFPPIFVNLKKKGSGNEKMQFFKLKMVVHCKLSKIYEKYLLKEFLCYKLYNSFTNKSFKVRLLNVKYIDTSSKKIKETKMYAFFIEDLKMMAERLNAKIDKNKNLSQVHIHQQQIMELAMFQFMIGNFDWGVPTQQNIKLIRPETAPDTIFAVPYDFDYCGMVNAPYAIPNEAIGIGSVRQRLYLGECKPIEDFAQVMRKFEMHKKGFYEVIRNFKYLSDNDKKNMLKYLDSFYKILNSKGFYSNHIKHSCKKIRHN